MDRFVLPFLAFCIIAIIVTTILAERRSDRRLADAAKKEQLESKREQRRSQSKPR